MSLNSTAHWLVSVFALLLLKKLYLPQIKAFDWLKRREDITFRYPPSFSANQTLQLEGDTAKQYFPCFSANESQQTNDIFTALLISPREKHQYQGQNRLRHWIINEYQPDKLNATILAYQIDRTSDVLSQLAKQQYD